MTTLPPSDHDFADHLIAADSPHPDLRAHYQKEIQALLVTRRTPKQRWITGALSALLLVLSAAGAWHAGHAFAGPESAFLRNFLLLMCAGAMAMSALHLAFALRGHCRRSTESALGLAVGVFWLGIAGLLLIRESWNLTDPLDQHYLSFAGTTMLIIAGGAMVAGCFEAMHFKTRERLLRIELAVADLAHQLHHR